MKKFFLLIMISIMAYSCSNSPNFISAEQIAKRAAEDSIRIADSLKIIMEQHNKIVSRTDIQSFMDTAGSHLYPVKIISARFYSEAYSSYKGVQLTFKNVSGKDIQAIRFEWYGINAFNEPADMGTTNGYGGGFTDELVRRGASRTLQWNILSNDGKKIIGARPYEVAFTDGTKWER